MDSLEEQVCVNDCFLFPKLDRKEWRHHLEDECPKCHEKRFEKRGDSIAPRKKFFRVPLSFQIENFKKNPRFVESLKKMKEEISKGVSPLTSFWGGSLVELFLENPSFGAEFAQIYLLSMGIDGVKCFKEANYSVWPVAFKIWNLHPNERTSKEFLMLGCLIPGIPSLCFPSLPLPSLPFSCFSFLSLLSSG